jgi:hypothetical protein
VDLSSGSWQTTLPAPALAAAQAGGAADPAEPAALACRPIGRLQRDEVVILIYELLDRATGMLRGYQSVVVSNGAEPHA